MNQLIVTEIGMEIVNWVDGEKITRKEERDPKHKRMGNLSPKQKRWR